MKLLQIVFLFSLLCTLIPGVIHSQDERTLMVESLNIEGNSKTDNDVILKYLTIEPGEPITREQLAENRRHLRSTNFFKEVNLRIMPGSEKGLARVVLNVEERSWPFFQFKSGFNELDGWYISPLGIRFDNIFGKGNLMGAEFLIGDRVAGTEIEFVRPFLWGSEYDFQIQLFGYGREFIHFFGNERFKQKVDDNGLRLRLSGNSGIPRFFSIDYIAHQVSVDSFLIPDSNDPQDIPAPAFLNKFSGEKKIRRLVISAHLDARNQKSYPTAGWWGGISFDQSSTNLGSSIDFQKIIIDIRRYQRLWKKFIAAFRLKLGSTSNGAPFYEKFYLGGPNSLRGYEDRSLTPKGYASNLTLGSVELRFPLSAKLKDTSRLSGVLFYDAGFARDDLDLWKFNRLNTGLGFGLRIKLPILGVVRLDFAYPVPTKEMQFHIALGQTF